MYSSGSTAEASEGSIQAFLECIINCKNNMGASTL